MELAGYNRWMEHPDEINVGSLIRLGERYVRVYKVEYIGDLDNPLYVIFFESGTEYDPRFTGEIKIHGNNQLETYTKHPS